MARRTSRNERGAAAVEFALVMPILLLLVFGAMQYGWYFYAMQAGTSATSDAVRRISVGDCQTATQLQNMVTTRLGAARAGSSTVTATPTFTASAAPHDPVASPGQVGGGVSLTVEFQTADFNFPFIPLPDDGKVVRTVFARVEDTTSSGACS